MSVGGDELNSEASSPDFCAVCGGRLEVELLTHNQPDRFERHVGIGEEGYHRRWVECSVCGTATNCQDPKNEDRLSRLASDYYEVDFAGCSISDKFHKVMSLPPDKSDNAGRVERIVSTVSRIQTHLPKIASGERKLMDIGAGTGVFLARFLNVTAEQGDAWGAVAVEPDRHAAEHLRCMGRFEVVQGLFVGQPELTDFDLVTLNKVVEHIAEPVPFLKLVSSALEPGRGVVYVEVPDVLTIGRRSKTDNILGALHHHLYSPFGLARLFDNAGLETLHLGRVFEPSGKLTIYGFACWAQLLDTMAKIFK